MQLPQHVAIVMDGNGRWAQQRRLERIEGHQAGIGAVKAVVQGCMENQIPYLSLFAFSSENWSRPEKEVAFLMQLFLKTLDKEINELHEKGVRLYFSGCRALLSEEIRRQMAFAEQLTQNNTRLTLNLALNYGGKWDITQALKAIALKASQKQLAVEEIDEELIQQHLNTSGLPDPDLFIRTSGESRLSNFFLWQLAYTELYFTPVLWPDFNKEEFTKALACFTQRERRYGRISRQLQESHHA